MVKRRGDAAPPEAAVLIPVQKHVKIGAPWAGLSLLEAVRRAFPELSPRDVFKMARTGEALLNGKRCQPLEILAEGDTITVTLLRAPPPKEKPVLRANEWVKTAAGFLWIVREDEDLLAVSKAAGCASHPAAGRSGDTLIDRVRRYLAVPPESEFQPALANRLDIDTSGLVLIGKNRNAQRKLGLYFQKGRVEKRYLALVAGSPPDAGDLTEPLEKKPDSRELAKYREGHPRREARIQEAHTRFAVRFRAAQPVLATLVGVELLTGRTHQIRRHFAGEGHPVALDRRYGDPEFNRAAREACGLDRMFLHAHKIRLAHPYTGAEMEITAPLPDDLADCLRALGGNPELLGK